MLLLLCLNNPFSIHYVLEREGEEADSSFSFLSSNYATNATMRISETYTNARNVIALSCGPSFAPMVAATVTAGAGQTIALSSLTVMLTIIAPLFLAVTH